MEVVHRSAHVPYTARQVFDLVDDIEHYPEFLPWCTAAQVKERQSDYTIASLTLEKKGLRKRFTTKNTVEVGRKLEMHLVEGPFKHLYGVWTFEPTDNGCQVTVSLEFDFASRIIAMLLGPIFNHAANNLLEAFVARAHALYGDNKCE